jgi:hypothetical protein
MAVDADPLFHACKRRLATMLAVALGAMGHGPDLVFVVKRAAMAGRARFVGGRNPAVVEACQP